MKLDDLNKKYDKLQIKYGSKDLNSIYKYGVFSKELVVNDIRLQSTLDKYVEDELNKCKNPLISISLNVSNCDTFNIFDV